MKYIIRTEGLVCQKYGSLNDPVERIRQSLGQFPKRCMWYDQRQGMVCSFCKQKFHTYSSCPGLPTTVEAKDRIEFVENLIRQPQVSLDIYRDMTLRQALEAMIKLGGELNEGNP